MLYQTDIECAKCGGNLYAESSELDGPGVPALPNQPTLLFRIEPCKQCMADAHNEGVNEATENTIKIYEKLYNRA